MMETISSIRSFAIPMRNRFRGVTVREGLLLRGVYGWGEFAPFKEYSPAEAVPWLLSALEQANTEFPVSIRNEIPVNCTVPAVDPDEAFAIVQGSGCCTAKVKVAEQGQSVRDDAARVEAVRAALGPAGKLRIDANGAWDVEQARTNIGQLAQWNLEYVEQPCSTVEELAAVRRIVAVPIAADESIRRADDPLRVAKLDAADIVVLKAAPLGGVRRALRIAHECGLPAVVSSAIDTSIGLRAGLALAAALPELPYACGLATTSLLTADVVDDPLRPVNGVITVRDVQVSDDICEQAEPTSSRHRWWLAHLNATAKQAQLEGAL